MIAPCGYGDVMCLAWLLLGIGAAVRFELANPQAIDSELLWDLTVFSF